ncbi:amidohydrolase family protein [Spirochaeta isovalerica]|uniref:L-fuconolactonase n=1 Tax=Spirochaeta isovalerica TaxID=150 RepID=A0A841RDI2_9SPIO|nr:L-fuconolactonase [Spirochaeta isovalerica]
MKKIIDAHHHLWQYNNREFGWIDESMSVLRNNFSMEDFRKETAFASEVKSIVVQARQSLEETEWLLSLSESDNTIAGVVGWVPLRSPVIRDHLDRMKNRGGLTGVRHVIQDEPDRDFMLRNDFNNGVSALKDFNLTYDILVKEKQLPETVAFVKKHGNQPFVIDHIAKPDIKNRSFDYWARYMGELASFPNVSCKLSGLVTEADWTKWSPEDLKPYIERMLELFSPRRLMFGSDWPVCLVAGGYEKWFKTLDSFLSELSESEREGIYSGNAAEFYGV